uniref:B2126_F1_18 n=1 Tax=Mycobacterium leprae TaxID=1769 RepID=Q49796_MYCLR|nr:B2126_F1_18 [Mycobacterium leprae]CAA22927.1 hypothetical protein MLCB2533.13c [Mycobacterium leprae]
MTQPGASRQDRPVGQMELSSRVCLPDLLSVDTRTQPAHVLQDDLTNSYARETDRPQRPCLQVLAEVGFSINCPAGTRTLTSNQSANVDDPLTLLARNPRPVIRIGGVGKILVFSELVNDRVEQMLNSQPGLTGLQH